MERTCANCKNLAVNTAAMRMRTAYCSATENIVPHKYDGDKPEEFTFWRVPESCPRSDSEVEKRADRIPEKDWETRIIAVSAQ